MNAQPAEPVGRFVFLDARSRRLPCPLLNDKGVLVGAEDCLYLNVYTPEVGEQLTNTDPNHTQILREPKPEP